MSIEKMELVNIVGRMKDLDQTLLKCMESGCFHIESSTKTLSSEQKQGFIKLTEQNPYTSLVKRIVSINFGETFDFKETKWLAKETDSDFLKYTEKYIDKTEKSFNDLNQKMLDSQQRINSLTNEETQIVHLIRMDTNMKELFSCKHIKIRFGRLPVESLNITMTRHLYLFLMIMTKVIIGAYISRSQSMHRKLTIFLILFTMRE